MHWHKSLENVLTQIGEECQYKAKIHRICYDYFNKRNIKFQLPVIIFSVLSGSGNFVASNFPTIEKWMILGIGGLSMATSIISSIAQFLKLSQLSEGHRIAYISWEKFYTQIRIQMGLRRKFRAPAEDFYNNIVMNYNRLNEISPEIPVTFIKSMKSTNKKVKRQSSLPYYAAKFQNIDCYNSENSSVKNEEVSFEKKETMLSKIIIDKSKNNDSSSSSESSLIKLDTPESKNNNT